MTTDGHDDTITPEYLLNNLLSVMAEDHSVQSVAYVARMHDGTVASGWSDMAHTEVIGLFEIGKLQAVKDMWNEWTP